MKKVPAKRKKAPGQSGWIREILNSQLFKDWSASGRIDEVNLWAFAASLGLRTTERAAVIARVGEVHARATDRRLWSIVSYLDAAREAFHWLKAASSLWTE